MKFIPLNIRTIYSFLKSTIKSQDIIKAVLKLNYGGIGINDFKAFYGACEVEDLCLKNNIKHALGSSLEVDDLAISVYIKNETGYDNLVRLISSSSKEPITFELFKLHSDGLIIIFPALQKAINVFEEDAVDTLRKRLIPYAMLTNDLYLGIDMNDPMNQFYNEQARKFAANFNYKCVAFPLIEYFKGDDAIALKTLESIEKQEKLDIKELAGWNYFKTNETYEAEYSYNEIENQYEIINKINFSLFQKRGNILNYGKLMHRDSKELLHELALTGLKRINKENDPVYIERLEYELSVINKMGFADYFLIVQDLIAYAKTHGIGIGPGRGSSAGSLVSFVLGITEVDSIKYNLLFERFLNPERSNLPDIDIDIEDVKRDQLLTYIKEKYGEELVAHVVTYQTIGAKQALRDVGRVFNYPIKDIDKMSKLLTGYNVTLREAYKTYPRFKELVDSDPYYLNIVKQASRIEGAIRQKGQHAAGIILNDVPLEKVMPVVYDSDFVVSQYDKDYLEKMNFLKIDLLGLRNLQTITYALELINKHGKKPLTMYTIPYEDANVYQTIREDRVMGLFQLESAGMRNAIREVKPDSFEDIVAILALFRPGPMKNIPVFAKRKQGLEKIPPMIPQLEQILKPTYGIVIYQEQIMELVRSMAGFSYGQADTFRKAISSKNKESMEKLRQSFMDGAKKNGHSFMDANTAFETIERFASYGFNRSHSLSYAIVACRMGYLKHYYPGEFFSALLETTSLVNEDKTQDYIKEMQYYGLKLRNPSIKRSEERYYNDGIEIISPLSVIKGVRQETVRRIIEIRENRKGFGDYFDAFTALAPLKLDRDVYLSLINAGAFDDFSINRATLRHNLDKIIDFSSLVQNLELVETLKPKIDMIEDDKKIDLQFEEEALGITLSNNVLEANKDIILSYKADNLRKLILAHDYSQSTIIGKIDRARQIKDKDGKAMLFMDFTTLDSTISVTVFPETYKLYQDIIAKNNLLVVVGHLNSYKGRVTYVATEIKELKEGI